jgi:hypothetical protein
LVLSSGRVLLQAREEFDGLGDFREHVALHMGTYTVRGQRRRITHVSQCLREADLLDHWSHFSEIGLLDSSHLFIL